MIETQVLNEADKALSNLLEGNSRFTSNLRINRDYLKEVERNREGQKPFAVVISCMDSRTSVELIFDQGIGDIFSIRIAGNVVTPEVIASCEYACHVVGTPLIVVLGHSGCGAIRGAIDNVELGNLHTILNRIKDNVGNVKFTRLSSNVDAVTEENVKAGIRTLTSESEVLRNLLEENKLKIVGGVYDINNGTVNFH